MSNRSVLAKAGARRRRPARLSSLPAHAPDPTTNPAASPSMGLSRSHFP
ncbi:MAG: hypothetical protein J0L61_10400 [Planctomycetes bacterium]|nr:hypothetical protein [Planctomycetota bacterium]